MTGSLAARGLLAFDAQIARAERVIAVALLVATVILVCLQVFFRFVLNDSLTWSEEAARYLFVWAALLGFSSSVHAHRLFSFDLIYAALPPAGRSACKVIYALAAIGFIWVLVRDGGVLVASTWTQASPAIELPMAIPYAALPVGGLLVAIHMAAALAAPRRMSPDDPGHGT